jgi:hypothetical protein
MLDRRTTVRIILGSYVALHFASVLPWAVELFSTNGMLPDGTASPLLRAFPNILALCDAPAMVLALVALGAASGVAIAAGVRDRVSAGIALYVTACVFGRNPLIANPAMPYVGLMLLAWCAAPRPRDGRAWSPALLRALWISMAVGYTYSGITKLAAPSWVDGQAFAYVLTNPLARDTGLRELLLSQPPWLLRVLTWGTLGFEIAFAPLALSRRARPWLWAGMLCMHVGLLVLIDFADLTLGMVALHLCTFDRRWLHRYGQSGSSGHMSSKGQTPSDSSR